MSNNKTFNTWDDVDWQIARQNVRKMQYQIYDTSRLGLGYTKQLHTLQKRLGNTIWAKLLAVQLVTTLNKGRRSAGVDRILVVTAKQKWDLAQSLRLDGESLPIRRVWIDKPGKTEKRPFGIPAIRDRAKQALAKLVLEPEWEAKFEPSSYGFRPGRSCHDAIERIFTTMNKGVPKWIFNADIRKCFDRIDHQALLEKFNTFPEMKRQARAWLKAGVMEGYANTPKAIISTEEGTPEGGVISSLFANIALHGLESELKDFVSKMPGAPYPGARSATIAKRNALTVVRYADDFVVIHRNTDILNRCIVHMKAWLLSAGLTLNQDKSIFRDGREGFDFLGFRIILVRRQSESYKVKIYPSKDSQALIIDRTRQVIASKKAVSSYQLIQHLRPIIIGWANYYSSCECKSVFSKLTNLIFQQVRAWVFRRDRKHGRRIVKAKYFPTEKTYLFNGREYNDNWILAGKQKHKGGVIGENFLPHIKWIKSRKHVMVKGDASPFDRDLSLYWFLRSERYSSFPKRITTLLKSQSGFCGICKKRFTIFDSSSWEVDHIESKRLGGLDQYKNLQLVHNTCHRDKTNAEQATTRR